MRTFQCSICEEIVPVSGLSQSSLRLSGAVSRSEAVTLLSPEDLICADCELEYEDGSPHPARPAERLAHSEPEAWYLSGLVMDEGEESAYRLNH